MERAHPELTHGDVHLALIEQRILGDLKGDSGGFRIGSETPLARHLRHRAEVVIGEHIGECAPEVP